MSSKKFTKSGLTRRVLCYSEASKFVLDLGINTGDTIDIPSHCIAGPEKIPNPEIYIDRLPRPPYRQYQFRDKSSISINSHGVYLGISGAYSSKRLIPGTAEHIELQRENLKYDALMRESTANYYKKFPR